MRYPLPGSDESQALINKLTASEFRLDLRRLAMNYWPWGEEGTPLRDFKEPELWQCDLLDRVSAHLQDDVGRVARGQEPEVFKAAVCSGHGTGKGAMTGILINLIMATRWGGTIITSANKEDQLRYRTWSEIHKWHSMSLGRHLFESSGMLMKPATWFAKLLQEQHSINHEYYYAKGELWSQENPDAYAGVHNRLGLTTIFDESSGIYNKIWTISEGFYTDKVLNRLFFTWSNGRRNTGRFFDCFGKLAHTFNFLLNLDSRTVSLTDKKYLQGIIEQYGEDSDEAKVMVKGQFPSLGEDQFIGLDTIAEARTRPLFPDRYAVPILGVDPARKGKNKTVLRWRIGRDARSIPPIERDGFDSVQVTQLIRHEVERIRTLGNYQQKDIHICIDAGQGTGIFDNLTHAHYPNLNLVWFSGKSSDPQWLDLRTDIWAKMKTWLMSGGCIDNLDTLKDDLAGPMIERWGDSDRRKLESKDSMEARGLESPDHGDALACTFAIDPLPLNSVSYSHADGNAPRVAHGTDYDVYGRYASE